MFYILYYADKQQTKSITLAKKQKPTQNEWVRTPGARFELATNGLTVTPGTAPYNIPENVATTGLNV